VKVPLSEKLRPKSLDDLIGQEHLIGDDSFLKSLVTNHEPLSLLLWGPPGCGKTTFARIYGKSLNAGFHQLSAVSTSINDIKAIFKESEKEPLFNPYVVIFLDEIHRFNKSQQDLFLPFLESGKLILIGATTENPSFSLNNALLSRMRVFTFKALTNEDLHEMIKRFEKVHKPLPIDIEAKDFLVKISNGDGRYLLNMIENIQLIKTASILNTETLKKFLQKRAPLFDKGGDNHYNLISAFHKSIRGSDPDASLYWLARMLNGGEDPLYIGRRLIRAASEDIGLADPNALTICLNAFQAYQVLGSPEGEIALAGAATYLALAPKSNAIYKAFKTATHDAKSSSQLNPPLHILNAPTPFMKEEGYGKGYEYDHNLSDQFSGQSYFPDEFQRRPSFYQPNAVGEEREMKKRLEYFSQLRNQKKSLK
jgi:putative ATPase